MTITLKQFLRELASNVFSDSSKKATSKLSVNLTTKQCYTLECCANQDDVIRDFYSCRTKLFKLGYLHREICKNGTKTSNGHPKHIYSLTPKGKAIHKEIVEKFTPVVKRINTQIEVGL